MSLRQQLEKATASILKRGVRIKTKFNFVEDAPQEHAVYGPFKRRLIIRLLERIILFLDKVELQLDSDQFIEKEVLKDECKGRIAQLKSKKVDKGEFS